MYQRRFREVWRQCFMWLVLLSAGLFFYGASGSIFLIGLAAGMHGWIALSAMSEEQSEPNPRLTRRQLLLMGVVALIFYHAIGRVVGRYIVTGYATHTVPHKQVRAGDYLLGCRSPAQRGDLPRGCLVLVEAPIVNYYGRNYLHANETERVVAQLIGRPGDRVQIRNGAFGVNGSTLNAYAYPVPRWLNGREIDVRLREQQYFVSIAYRVRGRGGLTTKGVLAVCVRPAESIKARMFARWLPVRRRGFLGGRS